MIYFIPSWGNKQRDLLNIDEMIGQIRALMCEEKDYKVLVSDCIPELRYFLHGFDLLESSYASLYDALQGSDDFDPVMVRFSDLSFPEDASFNYTPFNILVYQTQTLIGKIVLGQGSQVLEAHHYLGDGKMTVEIYDDRGFVSMIQKYEGNEHLYTEYLDVRGEVVFCENKGNGHCEVNVNNPKGLLCSSYTSKVSLQFEMLHQYLNEKDEGTSVIVSVDEGNVEELKRSPYLSEMTLSIFQERYHIDWKSPSVMIPLIKKAQGVIIDRYLPFVHLQSKLEASQNIYHLAPYDSRFDLSISQELKVELLYLDVRLTDNDALRVTVEQIIQYFTFVLSQNNQDREFKVFVRTEGQGEVSQFNEILNDILRKSFPQAMAYIDDLSPVEDGENALDEEDLEKEKQEGVEHLSLVKSLKNSWEIQPIFDENNIFKIIHESRLIIDMSEQPDMFTQIAGISAGLPQINRVETEYVKDEKNGLILSRLDDLEAGLKYYLDGLRHWQEARAYSTQQIKKFSGSELSQKLHEIVERKI